ncbi:MAG TPA: mechanosensitive ion channel family protein [Opitutaceae bacterium]|nr:mechanosensitive ion channel family protein [Opitutaceae bacterium]
MTSCRLLCLSLLTFASFAIAAFGQTPAESTAATSPDPNTTAAAAAVARGDVVVQTPDFLEHLVDGILEVFDVETSGNSVTHYVVAGLFFVGALVLRRVVTRLLFGVFRRLASKTETTLDDKLFVALEGPVGAFVVLIGTLAAIKVLKLSPSADHAVRYGTTMAFSLVVFWLLLRAFNTVLGHLQDIAVQRKMGIAAFMPWIRKTLLVVFVAFGILMIAQSLGADVKAFLAGLGIGGLAVALAAQDTLANVFGSVVVAVDQPFKIGEAVKIGAHTGTVEDIGLRSTKLRNPDRSLTVVPNKTVAGEAIVNLSRFTQRRVEQVIGLKYDASPSNIEGVIADIKALILDQPEVDKCSVMVYFRDFNTSSLDLWVVYMTKDPDFQKHMTLRQRLNLGFMRIVETRGLSFAFPSQSIYVEGDPFRAKKPADSDSLTNQQPPASA